jgi:GTPase SAR1 family protein
MYYLFVINMPPSTLIQSVVYKPSKRKDVFYEMSSTCPVCKLKCSRKDVMLRHKRNKHGTTHPYPQSSDAYPPLRERYTPQPPPPPLREGNTPQPPPPQQPYSQSNEEEPYYILKTNNPYTFYVPDGYDPDHFMPWVHPFTSVISGPTGSGKSVFVRRFVHNIKHMMTPIPDRILWCYGEYQTLYGTVDGVDFHQGLPDLDTLDPREKHLIILDDLMDETDQRVASLFTKKSHHRNISVMYIVQNLFHRGKHHRTISLNAHYMVVFKNPRDVSQIMALAHQMYPQRTKYFLEAYTAATARPHGYLVIDMKQETPDILRLRSHIFPGEEQKAYADI